MADILDFRVKNGLAVTNTATIESTLQATSTNTGALRVYGGTGIGGNLYVGGVTSSTQLVITGTADVRATTVSTTSTDGALTVAGGVGISGALNVGGNTRIISTTNASDEYTGALVVAGGLGVGGDLYVSGTVYGSILGSISTATNLANGTAGQIPYQTTIGVTSFFGPGTAGQFLKSNGTLAPSYVDTATIYVGYSVTATDLNLGATGSIPYQANPGDTTFLSIGSAAQILTVNAGGTAPEWSNTTSVVVGFATTATVSRRVETRNLTPTVGSYYLTFVDSNNASATGELLYTSSTVQFDPTTSGWVGIGVAPSTSYKLYVGGAMASTGQLYAAASTNATSTTTGALRVAGGAGVGLNLYVGNTASILSQAFSTSTLGGNALYVAGGVAIGKSLYVGGPVLFQDNVTFSGTTTNVYSTNTVYTDNIIDMHFPAGQGGSGEWTTDDGKDIGWIFHHYMSPGSGDEDSALIWRNEADELQWWNSGIEFVSTGTWNFNGSTATMGVFRTGAIRLVHTTASVSTATGALTVEGGVGIGGDLWVGGTIHGTAEVVGTITTASNIYLGTAGQVPYQVEPGVTNFFGPGTAGQFLKSNGTSAPAYVDTSTIYVGYSVTATNLNAGTVGQIPFQSAVGVTSFFGAGTAGQILVSAGASASGPVFTNTGSIYVGYSANSNNAQLTNDVTSSTPQFLTFVSTTTGYTGVKAAAMSGLVYVPSTGNFGIGRTTPTATLDVNGGVLISNITTVTDVTNASSTATGALQVRGGAAVGLDLRVGGSATLGGDLAVNGGDITSSAATFNLLNSGVTTLNLAGAGTAITIGSDSAGTTTIRNITAITSNTNATSTATGALRVAGGVGVGGDIWARNIYSNGGLVGASATTATHIAGGTAGQTPYQTAPGVTSFYGPGTTGTILVSGGTSGPSYTSTSSIYVGYAVTATNLNGGAAGGISYQTAPGVSTFLTIGTSGFVLTSNGSAPTWTSVSGLTAGQTDKIKTLSTTGSAVNYLTFVDSNNTSTLYEDVFTTSSFVVVPSTGFVGLGVVTPNSRLDVGGAVRISGVTTVTDATESISLTTGALQIAGGAAITKNIFVGGSGYLTGDLWINGGDLFTNQTSFNLVNTTATTINFGGAGTAITIGAATGFTQIRNQTTVTNTTVSTNTTTGALQVYGGIGVGDSIYVKNKVGYVNTSNVSRVYQYYNAATDSLDTVFE